MLPKINEKRNTDCIRHAVPYTTNMGYIYIHTMYFTN
jgi:hypothetical protein